jgi:hypothetical protein
MRAKYFAMTVFPVEMSCEMSQKDGENEEEIFQKKE